MHVPGTDRDQLWVAASGHQVLWAENARPGQLFTGVQTAKIKAQLVFRPDDGGNNRDEF
jgi:tRNA(Ile)-lysidine synthase